MRFPCAEHSGRKKRLRWTVHTLEIFMWPEGYDLSPDGPFPSGPYLDLLPEFWPEGWDDEDDDALDNDTPEAEVYRQVQIEYADETSQEIVSYQDYLFDKPAELLFALSEYFDPDTEDFDGDLEAG